MSEEKKVYGDLLPVETGMLSALHRARDIRLSEIGRLQYRMHQLLQELDEAESRGRQVLEGVRERLGIDPTEGWQVIEGKALGL